MGREEFEVLKSGVVKRKLKRKAGLFIDGAGLDRATRRLDRKVDLAGLVKGLTYGIECEVAKYYTLIPHEDDARQFAFLDAVERAGMEVIVKRLPPKGVKRLVSMDVHLASDLVSYCFGHYEIGQTSKIAEGAVPHGNTMPARSANKQSVNRIATIVCPSREVSYAIYMAHLLGIETCLADFGNYGTSSGWKGVDRWLDLSTSETIWRG